MATSSESWTNLSAPAKVPSSADEKVVRRFEVPVAMPQGSAIPRRSNRLGRPRSVHFSSDGTDSWKQLSNGILRDYNDLDDDDDVEDYVQTDESDETHSSDTGHGVAEIEDTVEVVSIGHLKSAPAVDGPSAEALNGEQLLKRYLELPLVPQLTDRSDEDEDTVAEEEKIYSEQLEGDTANDDTPRPLSARNFISEEQLMKKRAAAERPMENGCAAEGENVDEDEVDEVDRAEKVDDGEAEVKPDAARKQESRKKDPAFIERLQDTLKSSYTRLNAGLEPCPWLSFEGKIWPRDAFNASIYVTPDLETDSSYRVENIHFKRRRIYAFLGPPGSGKSEAAAHLCRLYGAWELGHVDDQFSLLVYVKPAMLQAAGGSVEQFLWQTFLQLDEGATYEELVAWLADNSKRLLLLIDIDQNDHEWCRASDQLKAILHHEQFPAATVVVFADDAFLAQWAEAEGVRVNASFRLTGWRSDDVERHLLVYTDRVAAEEDRSGPVRAFEGLRSKLMNKEIASCSPQNAALLALLLASDPHAADLDLSQVIEALGVGRAAVYGLLIERASHGIDDGDGDSDDEKASARRAKTMKKLMNSRWTFVENGVTPGCYAGGGAFECGAFRARSRDLDEFCAAKHLLSQYFKARRDEVMGAALRDSAWWRQLQLCWDMEGGPQGGARLGQTLPFLAWLLRDEPAAVVAPLKRLYPKFSPDARRQCGHVCRQCLLEVGDRAEAWTDALSAVVGRRTADALLTEPTEDRRDVVDAGPNDGAETDDEGEGSGSSDEGRKRRRPKRRRHRRREPEDVKQLIGQVGGELVLNFNDLTRSLLSGDGDGAPTEDLLEPLASLVDDLGAVSGLRSLTVEFSVDTLPAEAFPILVALFEHELEPLRDLTLVCTSFRRSRWAGAGGRFGPDQLGAILAACAGFIGRCPALKRLQLIGCFLADAGVLAPLAEAIVAHPKLRSLTVEGQEGGTTVHRRSVAVLEEIVRRHGWRELHLNCSNFTAVARASSARGYQWTGANGYDRGVAEGRSSGLFSNDPPTRSHFGAGVGGGVGAASWVSCQRRSRYLSPGGLGWSSSMHDLRTDADGRLDRLDNRCASTSRLHDVGADYDTADGAYDDDTDADAGSEVLGALRGLDGHQRMRHVHLFTGAVSTSVHGVLLDALIGCRHLKTFSLSCTRLDDALMATLSSGLTCAVHLESFGVEGRWSATIDGGAIFGLIQAACAAGSVRSIRVKGRAINAASLRDLPFSLSNILTSPRREELAVRLEGEVMLIDERYRDILEALEKCETPEKITLTTEFTIV